MPLARLVAQQLRQPSGLVGRAFGAILNRANALIKPSGHRPARCSSWPARAWTSPSTWTACSASRATRTGYELIDGRALLSHRPKPLALVRSTDRPVAHAGGPIRARPVGRVERPPVEALLRDVWATEDPYRSFEQSLRAAELDRQIERSAAHRCFAVLDAGRVRACALVRPSAPPTLTWLTVAREARGDGLATAVLAAVCADLRDRGEPLIASAASAANIASLRWHLSRGFALGPDPLRELRR